MVAYCIMIGLNPKVYAQEIQFNKYDLDLSQKSGLCALQDSRGYMWFGTLNGLNRFDGQQIKTYYYGSSNLVSNTINVLFEDRKGGIWIGTPYGLNRYARKIDDFEKFDYAPPDSGLVNLAISDIIEDAKGNIWAASTQLLQYDRTKNAFIRFAPPLTPDALGIHNTYNFVFEDSKQNLWYASWHNLYIFNRETRQFKKIELFPQYISAVNQSSWNFVNMKEDANGKLWLGINNVGIVSFNYNNSINNFHFYKPKLFDSKNPPTKKISDFLIDSKNRLWICNDNTGITLFNLDQEIFTHYIYQPPFDIGLTEDAYLSVYEDHTGRIWIGSSTGGFDVVDSYYRKFKHYHKLENINSISNNIVISFIENSKRELIIGSYGGIDLYDQQRNIFTHYNENPRNYYFAGPQTMCIDRQGNLWCGTWNEGVFLLDNNKRIMAHYTSENSGLTSNIVCSIVEHEDKVFFGTFGGGLVIFDQTAQEWSSPVIDNSASNTISDNLIYMLYFDSKGTLWCGTVGSGIDRLVKGKGNAYSLTNFNTSDMDSNSISGSTVQSILEDKNGKLWMGTSSGLNLFNKDDSTFTRYSIEDGLPSNSIMGILEDDHENLWMSTQNGLAKMNISSKKIKAYNVVDGVQGKEFSRGACYKLNDGRMVFGGTNGFNLFHPDSIFDNPLPPPVAITDFKIFNKSVRFGENSPLKVPVSEADEIRLTYQDYVFSFEFASLNYTHPELNQYAYWLEGFEKSWNYVGTKNNVTYTNLNPGEYTFHVKASNNDGVWNTVGQSIKLIIKPPYWKTLWFRLLLSIIVIVLSLLFFYIRTAQIRKKNIYLENTVQTRTHEINEKNGLLLQRSEELNKTNILLEERQAQVEKQAKELTNTNIKLTESNEKLRELNSMKDKFFSIIGHDLKNPIGTIMGFSELLYEKSEKLNPEKTRMYAKYIFESSSKTYSLLENLLEWALSQSGRKEFKPMENAINSMIRSNIQLSNEQAYKKDISFIFDDNEIQGTVLCDRHMIDTVLRNLFSNAVKFSKPGNKILISLKKDEPDFLIVQVQDHGVGMSEVQLKQIFSIGKSYTTEGTIGETGTGLGLILCKEFVEINKGKIEVESVVGKGTTFSFSLPLIET
jgi:signal transduction histidine kinase/ligand-binding sensor domain-containing protein